MPIIIFAPSYLKIISLADCILAYSLEGNCSTNFLFSFYIANFLFMGFFPISPHTCYYSSISKIKLSFDPIFPFSYCPSLLPFKMKFLETIIFTPTSIYLILFPLKPTLLRLLSFTILPLQHLPIFPMTFTLTNSGTISQTSFDQSAMFTAYGVSLLLATSYFCFVLFFTTLNFLLIILHQFSLIVSVYH